MDKVGTRQNASATAARPIARNAEAWGWQLSARCRGTDPSLFFHPDGERGLKRRQRQQNAKEFCAQCPVAMDCLEYSLRFSEPYGTWGGVAEDERHTIVERATARARKSPTYRDLQDDQARESVSGASEPGDL